MADEKPAQLIVTDPHRPHSIFVNQLVGSGHLNGVVNCTFATANFTPDNKGGIDADLVITARLRMDLFCAQQLYERLGQIIQETVKNETKQ